MKLNENRLPADDSHEISCLFFFFFEKAAKFEIVVCSKNKVALLGSVGCHNCVFCLSSLCRVTNNSLRPRKRFMFLSSAVFFSKSTLSEQFSQETILVSNKFDADQA